MYVLMVHAYMHGIGLKILQGESPLVPSESPLPPAGTETGTRAGNSEPVDVQVAAARVPVCLCVHIHTEESVCTHMCCWCMSTYRHAYYTYIIHIIKWIPTGCTTHAVRLGASVGG